MFKYCLVVSVHKAFHVFCATVAYSHGVSVKKRV